MATFFFLFSVFIFNSFPNNQNKEKEIIELTEFYGFDFGTSYAEIFESMKKNGFEADDVVENKTLFYKKIPFDNCPFGKKQDAEVTFNFENGKLVSGTGYFLMDIEGDEDHLVGPVLKIIGWYDDMYDFKRKYKRENLKEQKLVLYTCTGTIKNEKSFVMKIYDYKDGRPRHASVTACNFVSK